jgi:predicted DNA-binding WGR domain protein
MLAVRFELVDREHHRERFYSLALVYDAQLSLVAEPPGVVLVVTRGRLGGKAIVRRERFASRSRALERWGELACRRRRNGYREVNEGGRP